MTPEHEKEIRRVRSLTPDTDPWEASVVDELLAEIDRLRAFYAGADSYQWALVQSFIKEREELREKLDVAVEALRFYEQWENNTANAWSKTYQRTVLSVDYPGPSKASEALAKIGGGDDS